ncbi:MAG TPA: two-component regulator propeller domain-containing protein, partial [Bacteroidia bacterium]|nr:two-component regulator propeller domain-containing protein [Bacteroidia bacterium]
MKRCLFSLFFLTCSIVGAQQYNFRNYSVADGLAQSQVYAMAEDERGYLWLGTQGGGLSCFDGQQFHTFTEDDGLPNAFIQCIKCDGKGNIYIGTDEGAVRYDGEKFNKLIFPGDEGRVYDFCFGKDSTLYIATNDSGLVVIKDRKVQAHYYYQHGLPSNRVYCVLQNDNGDVWAGTEQGAARIRNGIAKTFGKAENFPVIGYRAIIKDQQDKLWFATYGNGLISYGDSGVKRFTVENGLSNNSVQCMTLDHSGRIWVGTATGVTRISLNEVKQFSETEGLCSNVVYAMLEDSWGNMWFGTSGGGACVLDGERFIHFNEKSGDMGTWVYAVHCDKKGRTWFGTSRGGVTEYDGTYYTNYYEGAGFTSAKVRAIAEDTSGNMWFGTVGDGAYELSNGSFRHFTHSDGLAGNFVNTIIIDSLNRVWMGTAGWGISIYDPATNSFLRVANKQGLISQRINCLTSDLSGNIWACSQAGGIFLMQYDSAGASVVHNYSSSTGLKSDIFRSATCDPFGNMWFGT